MSVTGPVESDSGKNQAQLILVGVVVILLLLGCVLVFPKLLVPTKSVSPADVPSAKERLELENSKHKLQNDVRATLLQGLAGAFFLATAFFTWRQIRISQQQLLVNSQQLQLSRQVQIAERLTQAIGQLGEESVDVRIGGIYALERLGETSEGIQKSIHEILCAFARNHSPWPPLGTRMKEKQPTEAWSNEASWRSLVALQIRKSLVAAERGVQKLHRQSGRAATSISGNERPRRWPRWIHAKDGQAGAEVGAPPLRARVPDVQAALTVLARRDMTIKRAPYPWRPEELEEEWESLREVLFLANLDLRRCNLYQANLVYSNLRMSNLGRAYLQLADLRGAWLWNADLRQANLQQAQLTRAMLLGANLQSANLRGVNFAGAALGLHSQEEIPPEEIRWFTAIEVMPKAFGADLRGADLHGADFTYAHLGEIGSTMGSTT
jgi:hypothetical protein